METVHSSILAPIVSVFQKAEVLLGNKEYNLTNISALRDSSKFWAGVEDAVKQSMLAEYDEAQMIGGNDPRVPHAHKLEMADLYAESKEYFDECGYSWCSNPSSFRDTLEVRFQTWVLRIIRGMNKDELAKEQYSNICVRIIGSPEINAHTFIVNDYKYIVFTTAFIKTLNIFAVAHAKLVNLGGDENANNSSTSTAYVSTNWLKGHSIGTVIAGKSTEIKVIAEEFISAIASYYIGDYLPKNEPLLHVTKTDAEYIWYGINVYDPTEVFVLCHELAHLLEHRENKNKRNLDEEMRADQASISMQMILVSEIDTMQRTPTIPIGAAIFFNLLHFGLMIKKIIISNAIAEEVKDDGESFVRLIKEQLQPINIYIGELRQRRDYIYYIFARYKLFIFFNLYKDITNELMLFFCIGLAVFKNGNVSANAVLENFLDEVVHFGGKS